MAKEIAKHKKASYDYHIHETMEAGIALEGWEVKALRLGKAQVTEGHGIIRKGEIWLVGVRIQAPHFACSYKICDEVRTKKLLLKKKQIARLEGLVQRQGYTLIPLKLYWKDGKKVKCELALASGKKDYDKRQDLKEKEWKREQERVHKKSLFRS